MNNAHVSDLMPMIRKLASIAPLSEHEIAAIKQLPIRIRAIPEDHDIIHDGDISTDCCLILDGFACRYKMVVGGRRQILSIHFAGDLPDLQSLHLNTMDHSLCALTPVRVGFIPHAAVRAMIHKHATLGDILVRHALIDAAIFREWMANIGRRTAYERIAHVICEVYVRMQAVGLARADTFRLPMTQAELGDATGLSTVHVNRVMQRLRREGVVTSRGDEHAIANWDRLREIGDFSPAYLHLVIPPTPDAGR